MPVYGSVCPTLHSPPTRSRRHGVTDHWRSTGHVIQIYIWADTQAPESRHRHCTHLLLKHCLSSIVNPLLEYASLQSLNTTAMLSKLVWGLCMLHSLAVCLHTSARPEPYGLSTSPRDISGRAVADDDGDLAPGERVSGPFCEIGSSGKHQSIVARISLELPYAWFGVNLTHQLISETR